MTTKDTFREQESTAIGTSKKNTDLIAKFAPKTGSWTCPVCLVRNEEQTTVCVACGAAKLSDGTTSVSQAPKTGIQLLNQATTSLAPNTVSGRLRENASSGSPFTFEKSVAGSVNSSPFKFGILDTGPVDSLQFKFGKSDTRPVNSSPFKFEISDTRPTNSFASQRMAKKDASKEQETTAVGTSQKSSDLMAKFAPKPGSWSCSVCLVTNEERTTICVACGAAKLSDGTTSAFEAPKTGSHLLNQATTSSGSNTVFGGYQGSPFTFRQSDPGSVNSSPFKFGISDSGPRNSLPFTFGSNNSEPAKNSPFTFATSNTGTTKSSTFTFVKSDAGTVNSSTFTFGKNDVGTISTSPFRFGVQPLAPDTSSTSETTAVTASQVVGGTNELPPTSMPPTTQPFVLASFGVPAIASKTNTASLTFGPSGLTGSSPLSVSENTATTVEKSVFGGTTPEKDGAALFSGSLSPHSTSNTQPDPLMSGKFNDVNQVTPNVSQEAKGIQNQSQLSLSTGTPTDRKEMPEETLFWQQPTRTFQFGQLDAYAPLDGATSWTAGVNPSNQTAQHSPKSETSQIQSALPTSEMVSQPFTLLDFSRSELLRRLVAAKEQDYASQESQVGGYNFTPYVVYEPADEASLQRATKPISTVILGECDDFDNEAVIEGSEDSTDEDLTYTSTEDDDENEDSIESSSPMPPIQSSQTQPPFSPSQGKPLSTPLKPVSIHSTLAENAGPANLPPQLSGGRFLTPKSALKAAKKQDEDCLIVYEVRASMANREKASHLLLPSNFFNYTKQEECPGCLGCRRVARESATLSKKEDEQSTVVSPSEENIRKPEKSESGNAIHVFGESSIVGQLTFSSVKPKETDAFSLTKNKDGAKPFQGAGAQLFAEISEDVEGQDEDKLHFEPVIPLPDEIKVVTGEEGLEVLFSERAKLYRFDADSGQWKERGVGDVKLLHHPKSGQGRVLMRREQIKKLCANHNINSGMELKPNIGSDRSWVWYTPADYAEGEARPEKLAIKFKSAEIAGKFKEVFEDLKVPMKSFHRHFKDTFSAGMPSETEPTGNQEGAGCTLYNQTPVKTIQKEEAEEVKDDLVTKLKAAEGSWECDICMLRNDSDKVECAACGGLKPGAEPSQNQKVHMKTSLPFGSSTTSSGSEFSFGSSTLSTGSGFSFNQTQSSASRFSFVSAEARQGDSKPGLSFSSFGQTSNSSSGVAIRFGSFTQKRNLSEHTVENHNVPSQLDEQTPGEDDSGGDEVESNAATDETQAEDASRQKTASSADPIKVDREEKPMSQSFVAGFSFCSPKTSQIGEKPILDFDSFSKKTNLSPGVPFSFGSYGQGGSVSEQTMENKKVIYRSGTPSTEAVPFSSATSLSFGSSPSPAGARFLFGSTTSSARAGFSFSSTTSPAAAGLSLGSTTSSARAGFSFSSTTSPAGAGLLLGSTTSSDKDGFSFSSTTSPAGAGFSFGSTTSPPATGVSFSSTTSPAGAGLLLGSTTSSAKAGFSFSSTTSPAGAGLLLGSTTSSAKAGFSCSSTTSAARAGRLSLGSTTSSARAGFSFSSTTSPPAAELSFGSTTSSARAGFSFSSTTSPARAGLSLESTTFSSTTSPPAAGSSFGSTTSLPAAGLSFGSTTSPPAAGLSLGSTASSASAGFSFSSTTSRAGAGLSLGSTTSSARAGFSFSSTTSPAGAGLLLGSTTSSDKAGFSFSSTKSPAGVGLSLGSTTSPPAAGFSFSSTASPAGAGLLLGSTTSSARAGFSFSSTTSPPGAGFSFGSITSSPCAGFSFSSTTSPAGAGFSFGSITSSP